MHKTENGKNVRGSEEEKCKKVNLNAKIYIIFYVYFVSQSQLCNFKTIFKIRNS